MSTVAQTFDHQDAALAAAGVTKTFSDTMSGARGDCPGLVALLDYARSGETVVVWKLEQADVVPPDLARVRVESLVLRLLATAWSPA